MRNIQSITLPPGKKLKLSLRRLRLVICPTYIADTEDANVKYGTIKGREVQLIEKKERIQFVWIYEAYCITGQTRLPEEEILRILQNIEL